jgi:5-formyltetrahydrofolate cyclo-ligase
MTKKEIRNVYKQKRLELAEKDRLKLDDLLLINFQQLWFDHVHVVMSYWPLQTMAELNTHIFTDFMAFRMPGMQLAYPVIKQGNMEAVVVDDDTNYQLNKYNIAEPVDGTIIVPEAIDMVLTPLLAFDANGYRVGYGKGYYDKFLAMCRPDVLKVGFSYFDPIDRIADVDEFDVPLDICITPNQTYEF